MSDTSTNERNYCLSEIHLQNFRCFEDFRMNLHPRLNVLVGANASGKTALLEGIRVGLSEHFHAFPQGKMVDFSEDDALIKVFNSNIERQTPVTGNYSMSLFNNNYIYSKNKNDKFSLNDYTDKRKDSFYFFTYALLNLVEKNDNDILLPLLAYYSVQRSQKIINSQDIPLFGSRFRGYTDSLDGGSFFRYFPEWLKMNTFAQLQAKLTEQEYHDTAYQLVENAIRNFLPEMKSIYFDVKLNVPVVSYREVAGKPARVTQPYSYLSAGEQNLIALIADIALRCAILNPDMGIQANETPGIVLIDEVDLHLHPSWQRTVIPNLRTAFPNLQFIITTHSPQVISSVPKESLFILKDYQVLTDQAFTEGRDTNQLLYDVFGVEERPAAFRDKLSHFYALLEAQNTAEAQMQFNELEALWGGMDHEIVRARLYLQDLLDEVVA